MRKITIALAVIGALVLPGTAWAATLSSDGFTATFRAGAEPNDLVVTQDSVLNQFYFTDYFGGLKTGDGCSGAGLITCPASNIDVRLGAGNDRANAYSTLLSRQTISGGDGEDVIGAGGNVNVVSGGADDDIIRNAANTGGTVHGDGGNDVIYTREGSASMFGDSGNDFIFLNGGMAGLLAGGSGNDTIISVGARILAGVADGGPGDDIIAFIPASTSGDDWEIHAGDGADTVKGSSLPDTISGGAGGDHIDVTGDGNADSVDCGGGFDTVYADAEDLIAANCELRYSEPMPSWYPLDSALERAQGLPAEIAQLLTEPRPPFDDPVETL